MGPGVFHQNFQQFMYDASRKTTPVQKYECTRTDYKISTVKSRSDNKLRGPVFQVFYHYYLKNSPKIEWALTIKLHALQLQSILSQVKKIENQNHGSYNMNLLCNSYRQKNDRKVKGIIGPAKKQSFLMVIQVCSGLICCHKRVYLAKISNQWFQLWCVLIFFSDVSRKWKNWNVRFLVESIFYKHKVPFGTRDLQKLQTLQNPIDRCESSIKKHGLSHQKKVNHANHKHTACCCGCVLSIWATHS